MSKLKKKPAEERAIYTVKEIAALLSISRNSCYQAIADGQIPHVRLGARILIPKETFHAWLRDPQES